MAIFKRRQVGRPDAAANGDIRGSNMLTHKGEHATVAFIDSSLAPGG